MALASWCNSPNSEFDLLFLALGIGFVGMAIVWFVRTRRLQRWDIERSPTAPSLVSTKWTIGLCVVIPAIVLSILIYVADPCAPVQKSTNILFLWLGAAACAGLSLLGVLVANRKYARGPWQ